MAENTPKELPGTDSRDLWMGFDLGGTKMLAAVYNPSFEMLGSRRRNTKGNEGSEAVIDRVKQTVLKALDEAKVSASRLGGIGIAVPGPVDHAAGVVLETPNLGWRDVPIRDILQDEFHCPVVVCNDVDAGVYGEYRFGAARDAQCVVGLFPGTGIGGGCVMNGDILRSSRLSCFEVGHIRMLPDGPRSSAGAHGSLESVASRLAIAAAAAQAVFRGEAPHLQEIAGTDLAKIRSGALAEAIEKGDRVIDEIVREAARNLGIAAGWLVNLLCPDVILLGGGLVEALPGLYAEEVRAGADTQVMDCYRKAFKVIVTSLGDFAAVQGAAAWARKNLQSGLTAPVRSL